MSENEDFFLDEDFLNDLDEKSQLYYSQIDNTEGNIIPNKRRKLYHDNNSDNRVGKKIIDKTSELSSRKNLILDIFENNSLSTAITTSSTTVTKVTASSSFVKKNPSHGNSKKSKENLLPSSSTRQLALEIMEKKCSESVQRRCKFSPESPRLLKTISSSDIIQTANNSPQTLNTTVDIDKYPSDLFKTPSSLCQPKTLVRKFPGPAGLIPDGLKNTLKDVLNDRLKENLMDDAIYYLENLIENEVNTSKPSDKSHMSEFCSQETKKLFSDGAWQRMLDDLPKNFLRGYDIASLKRPGRTNKVPLLAAVIHRIEHNAENPRIILRDISNSIEAIMHKDIPTKYPNILQAGVVVLLRDIGVLNFQGAQKYSTISVVMISPNSILGVYSDKERLVITPALNEILNRDYDVEPAITLNNLSNDNVNTLELRNKNVFKSNHDKHKLRFQAKFNREIAQPDLDNTNPIQDFDGMSDLDLDEPLNAFEHNNIRDSLVSNVDNSETIVTRAVIEAQPNNNTSINKNSLSLNLLSAISDDSTEIINVSGGTTISKSAGGFADDLFNDTDDEILSQLDVDSIANNHRDA